MATGNMQFGTSNDADSEQTTLKSIGKTETLHIQNTGAGSAILGEATGNEADGVSGFSKSWRGVHGSSDANAGVMGESKGFDGGYFESHSQEHAGVSGHNIWGEARKGSKADGYGVFGESDRAVRSEGDVSGGIHYASGGGLHGQRRCRERCEFQFIDAGAIGETRSGRNQPHARRGNRQEIEGVSAAG